MNDTPLLDGKNVLPSAILTSGVRPAYLRSASRSRQGVWPAALACWRRPPLLRPGLGSPSEGEWAMSEARNRPARALAGPRRCAGDRRPDLERAIFRMRVVPGTDPGWDGMILLLS
jgi:hypothetical protein